MGGDVGTQEAAALETRSLRESPHKVLPGIESAATGTTPLPSDEVYLAAMTDSDAAAMADLDAAAMTDLE